MICIYILVFSVPIIFEDIIVVIEMEVNFKYRVVILLIKGHSC